MFQCSYCNYESIYKYNVQRHEHVHNKNSTQNNIAPTTISVDSNVNNLSNQTQSGFGSVVTSSTHIPIEKHNEVVGIAHGWKRECEIKDNGIHARNEFLTANNSKLQVEHMRNKMLDVENERLQEENKNLELEKEALIEDGNNKVSAMGQDMGNLIHKYKNLKI